MPAVAARAPIAHPSPDEIRLEAVLHALADPHRLAVARALATTGGRMSCGDFGLPVSKSTLTYHFRVLRNSGLIRQAHRGTAILNDLRRDDLDLLFPGLLDAVFRAADRADRDPK